MSKLVKHCHAHIRQYTEPWTENKAGSFADFLSKLDTDLFTRVFLIMEASLCPSWAQAINSRCSLSTLSRLPNIELSCNCIVYDFNDVLKFNIFF